MQKDPGNPRQWVDEREPKSEPEWVRGDGIDMLATLVRGACLVGLFLLLFVAACLALQVFYHIGRFVTNPAAAQSSVDAIYGLISGEQLVVRGANDNRLELGRLTAFVLLLLCYLIWLYVPLKIVWVCGRILLQSMPGSGSRRDRRP